MQEVRLVGMLKDCCVIVGNLSTHTPPLRYSNGFLGALANGMGGGGRRECVHGPCCNDKSSDLHDMFKVGQ